jgi:hypothetical protein
LKPADELMEIRDRIKELEKREIEIRTELVEGRASLDGEFATVKLDRRKRRTFDRKSAEAEFGSLAQFDVLSEFVFVTVKRKPE